MQRCTHCGKEIQDNITLCPYCLNGTGGSHRNDLSDDWRPRREDGSTPVRRGGEPSRPKGGGSRPPFKTLGIAAVLVVCVVAAWILIIAPFQHQETGTSDLATIDEVLQQYHLSHPSNNTSLEETGEGAIDLVGLLSARGVTAHIQAGALERQVQDRDEVNRAWVLAAVNNSTKKTDGTFLNTTTWLASDPATGTTVTYDQNRYYYTGFAFNNTSAFQDFLDARQEYLNAQEEFSQATAAYQDLQQQSGSTKDYQQKVKLDYQIYTQAATVNQKKEAINQTLTRFRSIPIQ